MNRRSSATLRWLGGIVQGDFGNALTSSRPIADILAPRLFNTVMLSIYAFIIYLPLALIPALVQASRRDSKADHALSIVNLVFLSIPDFLLGTLLLVTFSVALPAPPGRVARRRRVVGNSIHPGHDASGHHSRHRHGGRGGADAARQPDRGAGFRLCPDGRAQGPAAARGPAPPRPAECPRSDAERDRHQSRLSHRRRGDRREGLFLSRVSAGSWSTRSSYRDVPLIEATVLIAAAVYVAANLLADLGAILLNPRLRSG